MTTPPSRFIILAIRATAGVVIMPASTTSWPLESIPAERAFLRKSPEGQELIRLYYEWCAAIVNAMKEDEAFRKGVKAMVDGFL